MTKPGSAPRILILDDEPSMRTVLQIGLAREGYEVDVEARPQLGIAKIRDQRYDLVISDLKMPGMSGLDVLKQARSCSPETRFILVTAFASSDSVIEALKLGAFDYITKPFDLEQLKTLVERALEGSRLREPSGRERKQVEEKGSLVGISRQMMNIYKLIGSLASTTSTILITGESGTGKELVARAIHDASDRAGHPFVSINCSALPEALLESELFGYMKGAFTGAAKDKPGLLEYASGGTVFLDEIGEMALSMQVKLLRALQQRRIRRLGGSEEIALDVRLIAATNRDLQAHIREEKFREDLYYRIAVIPIQMPPLRERMEDLPPLLEHFIYRYNRILGKAIHGVTPEAMQALQAYSWPGNVRELENVIERAVALETADQIQPERLPPFDAGEDAEPLYRQETGQENVSLPDYLKETERGLIEAALRATGGNQLKAAQRLNISYRSLRHRIAVLGIRKGDRQEAAPL